MSLQTVMMFERVPLAEMVTRGRGGKSPSRSGFLEKQLRVTPLRSPRLNGSDRFWLRSLSPGWNDALGWFWRFPSLLRGARGNKWSD